MYAQRPRPARFNIPMQCSRRSTSAVESALETPVAMATPATSSRSAVTNSTFSTTFAMPESMSAKNGERLSPRARSAAAPKS